MPGMLCLQGSASRRHSLKEVPLQLPGPYAQQVLHRHFGHTRNRRIPVELHLTADVACS